MTGDEILSMALSMTAGALVGWLGRAHIYVPPGYEETMFRRYTRRVWRILRRKP